MKRAAPVKTIQKHESEVTGKVYHIPVGPVRRRQVAAKPRQIEAPDAIEAEVIDGEAN